jgi:GntR family transcriptional regulator
MMILKEVIIDFASPVPVYEQIKKGIKQAIALRRLQMNDPLPSIREMAGFFKINPNTVARAYRELQFEEIIAGRAGKGFWVKKQENCKEENLDMLREEFKIFLERGIEMGLSPNDIKVIIDSFFQEVQ